MGCLLFADPRVKVLREKGGNIRRMCHLKSFLDLEEGRIYIYVCVWCGGVFYYILTYYIMKYRSNINI